MTKTLYKGDAPGRNNGSTFPLFVAYKGDGPQTAPVVRTEPSPALPAPKAPKPEVPAAALK